jgi:hypothetical protein
MSDTSLRDADPPLEATLLRHREVASDALHLWVVEAVGGELVVRGEPLEHGRALEDEVRLLSRARGRKRKQKEQCGHSRHDAAPKLQTTHSLASISKVRPYVEIAGKN